MLLWVQIFVSFFAWDLFWGAMKLICVPFEVLNLVAFKATLAIAKNSIYFFSAVAVLHCHFFVKHQDSDKECFIFQVLNEFFHNVCELDLVFNFYKVTQISFHSIPSNFFNIVWRGGGGGVWKKKVAKGESSSFCPRLTSAPRCWPAL